GGGWGPPLKGAENFWAAFPPNEPRPWGRSIAPPILTVPPPLTVTLLLLLFGAWSSIRTPFRAEEKVFLAGAERSTLPPLMERLEFPSNTRVTPDVGSIVLLLQVLQVTVPPVILIVAL